MLISCLHLGSIRAFDKKTREQITDNQEIKDITKYHFTTFNGFCIDDLYNNKFSLINKSRFGYIIRYFTKDQLRELIQILINESPNPILKHANEGKGDECYQLDPYDSLNVKGDNLRLFILECENLFDYVIRRIKFNSANKGIKKKELSLLESRWLAKVYGDPRLNQIFDDIEKIKKERRGFYEEYVKANPNILKVKSLKQLIHKSFQSDIERCDIYIENAVKRIENMQKTKERYSDFYDFLFEESYPKFIRKLYE